MASTRKAMQPALLRRPGWIVAALLPALVLTIGGNNRDRAAKAEEKIEANTALPADLAQVPAEAFGFVHIRVGAIWQNQALPELMRQLANERPYLMRMVKQSIGVPAEELERLTLLMLSPKDQAPLLILTTAKPYDRAKLLNAVVPDAREHKYKDKVYYTSKKAGRIAVHPVNDRVFVTGQVEDVVQNFVRLAKSKTGGPLQPALKLAAKEHHVVAALQVPEDVRAEIKTGAARQSNRDSLQDALTESLKPLLDVRSLTLVVDSGKETVLKLELAFADENQAKRAYWPARDGLAVLRLLMGAGRAQLKRDKQTAAFLPLLNQAEAALRTAAVKREDKTLQVTLRAKTDLKTLVSSTRTLLIATDQMRQAAARTQSANNLKQMGLAFHNYADTYKVLPAAAIYSKDGKPLLSWRVAILPFVEQDNLYKQFKLDEPWDSNHNKKLLATMPRLYAPLGRKTKQPYSTFYQVFFGKGAAFEGKQGMNMPGSFPDGTSNTIWLAEAAEAVPWTKPEDIKYEPGKPLPKLGGLFGGGFHVGFADGSVRFLKKGVDKDTLRALITRDGGEVIDLNKLR